MTRAGRAVRIGQLRRGHGPLPAALLAICLVYVAACEVPVGVSKGGAVVRVGASGDYAPFSTRLAGDPNAQGSARAYLGFDADIARLFAGATGRELVWVPFRWPELVPQLVSGDFDVAMSGVTVRPERSVAGRFSVPVAETGAVLLVRDAEVKLPPDLAGQLAVLGKAGVRIAVNRGGHLERVTRARFSEAEIHTIPDNAAVRAALFSGEFHAVVTDTLEAPGWVSGEPGITVVGPFTRDRKAYLLPAPASGLAARLDTWLLARERDGTLARLREEHFGAGAWHSTADPLSALLAAIDERLALMPYVADWKRAAGREVVDVAREERVLSAARDSVARAAGELGVPAPAGAQVRAFYRAQIAAAVDVQRVVLAGPESGGREEFDLAEELRPALLRIGERMARLLVRASRLSAAPELDARVRIALARHGLSDGRLSQIVDAIRAFSPDPRARNR